VTSVKGQSRFYLQDWDRGRKEKTFVLRKSSVIPKATAVTEPKVLKCPTMFSHANTICHHQQTPKTGLTTTHMTNTIFSCQTTFK